MLFGVDEVAIEVLSTLFRNRCGDSLLIPKKVVNVLKTDLDKLPKEGSKKEVRDSLWA